MKTSYTTTVQECTYTALHFYEHKAGRNKLCVKTTINYTVYFQYKLVSSMLEKVECVAILQRRGELFQTHFTCINHNFISSVRSPATSAANRTSMPGNLGRLSLKLKSMLSVQHNICFHSNCKYTCYKQEGLCIKEESK